VAIDQFEECLILQDEAGRKQLADLFASLREQPVANAGFLLTLRADYLDLDALRALALPDVQSDRNWFNLNALSRGEARAFLDQRLKLDEQMREKVIDEASEVDDLPGLVRPITLNMLGLVLQRYRGGTLEGAPPGRLIQSYLRQAMAKPGIDDLAPRLLGEMITDKGTKRPLDESALAERTTSSAGFVRKCLLLLAQEGVVRELARAASMGDQPRFRRASAQPDHPAAPAVLVPSRPGPSRTGSAGRLARTSSCPGHRRAGHHGTLCPQRPL
jgi:hypothetical protein